MENLKVAATITGSTLDEQKHLLDAIHGKTDKNMNNFGSAHTLEDLAAIVGV